MLIGDTKYPWQREIDYKMSVIKGKSEFRTILDFSKCKVSKNFVKQSLRVADVLEVYRTAENAPLTLVNNNIQVGIYRINLRFSDLEVTTGRSRLKQYGKFKISIYEKTRDGEVEVRLPKDGRFKHQYWVKLNQDSGLLMKTLVDVIVHCNRLNKLKLFL